MMRRRVPRLKYAVMEMGALRQAGFALPRPWQDALAEYVNTASGLWEKRSEDAPGLRS
jgi:dTDP-4-dehydrorhamnose reductase